MDALTLYLVLTLETFSLTLVMLVFQSRFVVHPELRWLTFGNFLGFLGLALLFVRFAYPSPLFIFLANLLLLTAFLAYGQASYSFWEIQLPFWYLISVLVFIFIIFALFTFLWPLNWVRIVVFSFAISAVSLISAFPPFPPDTEKTLLRFFHRVRIVYLAVAFLFLLRGILAFWEKPISPLAETPASMAFLYLTIFLVFFYNLAFVYLVLTRRNLSLESLNDTNNQIFRIVGHDLRGPLGSYENYFETLAYQACSEPDDFDSYIDVFRASARQARGLVESLLEWRSLSIGELSFRSLPVPLCPIGQEVVDLLRLQAQNKGVDLINRIAKEACLVADARAIQTILRNLVSNALNFSRSGQVVFLTSDSNQGKTFVVVEDQAGGIPQEVMSKLADNLHPVSRTGTAGERGSGFGLLLCRQWAKKAGLELRFDVREGNGTRAVLIGRTCQIY